MGRRAEGTTAACQVRLALTARGNSAFKALCLPCGTSGVTSTCSLPVTRSRCVRRGTKQRRLLMRR